MTDKALLFVKSTHLAQYFIEILHANQDVEDVKERYLMHSYALAQVVLAVIDGNIKETIDGKIVALDGFRNTILKVLESRRGEEEDVI